MMANIREFEPGKMSHSKAEGKYLARKLLVFLNLASQHDVTAKAAQLLRLKELFVT
jgi:hypothetical protein